MKLKQPKESKKEIQDQPPQIAELELKVERLQSAIQDLTLLNEIATKASGSTNVDKILDLIVHKSIEATKAEQGSILLVTDEPGAPLKTLIRQKDRQSRLFTYKIGETITGWVLINKKPLKIDNLAEDARFKTSQNEEAVIKSALCVPILFGAKILGILLVINKKTLEPFNNNDLRLLSIIAGQSGQLVRNSQLQEEALEREREKVEQERAISRQGRRSRPLRWRPDPSAEVRCA